MHGAQYCRTDRDRLGHGLGPTRRSRHPCGTFWIGHPSARVGLVRRATHGFAASIHRVNHEQAAAHEQPRLDGCAASARPLAVLRLRQRSPAAACDGRSAVVRRSCRCYVQWQCASSRCTPSMILSGGVSVRSGALSPGPRHPTPTVSIHFASWRSWSGRVAERASACWRRACTCPRVRSMTQSGHWNPKESYRRPRCRKPTMPPYGSIDHPRETASRPTIRLVFQPLGGRRSW